MKSKLKELILNSGADDCGICKATVFDELAPALSEGKRPFGEKITTDPFAVTADAKSIVVFAVSYNSRKVGNISSYAYGKDYHRVMPEIAAPALKFLKESGFCADFFADTGTLPERHLAYRAGLGFIGKNHCLIHPRLGSFIFIGYIITDCPLDADSPIAEKCADCGECTAKCPSGALGKNDFRLCLSYITQKKGELSPDEAALIKKTGCAWGCDICQRVCPHNAAAPEATHPAFSENLITELNIPEDISNREFAALYGEKAFSWRGKNVILRNLGILK